MRLRIQFLYVNTLIHNFLILLMKVRFKTIALLWKTTEEVVEILWMAEI